MVFDNPEEMRVRATVKDGRVVFREGEASPRERGRRRPGSLALNVAPLSRRKA